MDDDRSDRHPDRGRALVTGASVAGAATAYWLARIGYDVAVLERAPAFRDAGQNVDVRGAGREVLRRMGLEDRVRALTTGEVGTRFVDDEGRTVAELPVREGAGGDGPTAELEILRGDLARALVDACPDRVRWHYDEAVEAVRQDADGVEVDLRSGRHERWDLLVVAEGVGSHTRGMVVDEVEERRLGLAIAYGTIPRTADDDDWWRWLSTAGGRQATLRPDQYGTTRATLSFRTDEPGFGDLGTDEQRRVLRERFAGVGWEVPRILDGLDAADDLYAEDLTQIRAETWHRGRVVLTGDAAWCVTPVGGGGAALALIGAYVLAAQLSQTAPGTPVAPALAAYEEWLRPVVDDVQHLPPGTPAAAAPYSKTGVALFRLATRLAATGPVQGLAAKLTSGPGEDRELPPLAE